MDTNRISGGLELLVDHFRADPQRSVSLGDVAAVTEVLISSMQRYFNSIDVSIYQEFRNISEHISQARNEIAELRPNDLKTTKIPRAGKELEAIVESTEDATGTIMDAAEAIMAGDVSDIDAYKAMTTDACMRIFEACSFQDITGQRISKVVNTLTYIEDRLDMLQSAWGPGIEDAEVVEAETDASLLHGPSLAGEGIEQDTVDELMESDAELVEIEVSALDADADADVDVELNSEPEPEPEAAAAETPAPKKRAKPKAKPKAKPAQALEEPDAGDTPVADIDIEIDDDAMGNGSGKVSQADIDALFD